MARLYRQAPLNAIWEGEVSGSSASMRRRDGPSVSFQTDGPSSKPLDPVMTAEVNLEVDNLLKQNTLICKTRPAMTSSQKTGCRFRTEGVQVLPLSYSTAPGMGRKTPPKGPPCDCWEFCDSWELCMRVHVHLPVHLPAFLGGF